MSVVTATETYLAEWLPGTTLDGPASKASWARQRNARMSDDGQVLVVGSNAQPRPVYSSVTYVVGSVDRYDRVGDAWVHDVSGECTMTEAEALFYTDNTGPTEFLYFGQGVSIDATASKMIVSAVSADENVGTGSPITRGVLLTYTWSGSSWTRVGAAVIRNWQPDPTADPNAIGRNLALSGDGLVMAMGNSGSDFSQEIDGAIEIYNWVANEWVWQETIFLYWTTPSPDETADFVDRDMQLNSDGSKLFAGNVRSGDDPLGPRSYTFFTDVGAGFVRDTPPTITFAVPFNQNVYYDRNSSFTISRDWNQLFACYNDIDTASGYSEVWRFERTGADSFAEREQINPTNTDPEWADQNSTSYATNYTGTRLTVERGGTSETAPPVSVIETYDLVIGLAATCYLKSGDYGQIGTKCIAYAAPPLPPPPTGGGQLPQPPTIGGEPSPNLDGGTNDPLYKSCAYIIDSYNTAVVIMSNDSYTDYVEEKFISSTIYKDATGATVCI